MRTTMADKDADYVKDRSFDVREDDQFFEDETLHAFSSYDESLASTAPLFRYNIVKEAVPPEIFESCSRICMRVFFQDFERYFLHKYVGTDRDRCRVLGNFLKGDARRAFNVLGGTHLGYLSVKEMLLTWYDSELSLRRERAKSEFYMAQIQQGESFTLYCLRLEVLAHLAYPKSSTKAFKEYKKR